MTGIRTPVAILDLVPLLLRSVSSQKICMLLTLNGHIDTPVLATAMRYLLLRNPVLASELVISRGRPQWRYRGERMRQAAPQLISTAAADELLGSFPGSRAAGKGDTLEVHVFRSAQHDALCITIDHTAADAAGCREVVRQLSQIYTRLQRGEQFMIGGAAARPRELDSVWSELGRMRCLASMWRPGIAAPHWQFSTGTASDEQKPVYLLRHFEAGCRGGLQAVSRRHNATINDLLLAALFRALLATLPAGSSRRRPLQFTADLRRFLPAGQRARIANMSGSDCVWLDASKASRFSKLVAHTHEKMRRIKDSNLGAGSSLWLKLLFTIGFSRAQQLLHKAFNASRKSGIANPLLTNFGALDGHAFAFGATSVRHACLTAPSLLVPGLIVGVSSFRNTLTLSTGFDANIADPLLIGNVLDRMINDLESAY